MSGMRASLLAAIFGLALPVAPATAGIALCNGGDEDKLIAYIVDFPDLLFYREWTGIGWVTMRPDECVDFVTSTQGHSMVASVLSKREDGYELISFSRDDDDSISRVIEDAYCVSDEPFEKVLSYLEDFKTCGPGEYLQMFNLMIEGPSETDFTLTLP